MHTQTYATNQQLADARNEGWIAAFHEFSLGLDAETAHACLLAVERRLQAGLAFFRNGRWGSPNVVPLKSTPEYRAGLEEWAERAARAEERIASVRGLIQDVEEVL